MDKITEMKVKRYRFIHKLYEVTGGNQYVFVDMRDLGRELGFEDNEISRITDYLKGEGLLRYVAMGGGIGITHYGITQVEKALSQPEHATQYFPPINIINVSQMVNSLIQQGTMQSNQTGSFVTSDYHAIQDFVRDFKVKLAVLNLMSDDLKEMQSEIATIEAQLVSSRPKSSILKECFRSIRNVLEGATGSIVAAELLAKFPNIIG